MSDEMDFVPRSEKFSKKKKKRGNTIGREIKEWLLSIFVAVAIVFFIRTFLFTPTMVDGISMMPTLHHEDRMIINKMSEPKRFDIIVFHAPQQKNYIKRVIGLPGDHIEYRDDKLYINGTYYEEPYLEQYKEELNEGVLTFNFTLDTLNALQGESIVPEGHYFVLGDNRQISKDSRHIGFVDKTDVVGTSNFIFYPFDRFGTPESHMKNGGK
ncbi:MAG: signal peptidase I [Bacilli bacterium]